MGLWEGNRKPKSFVGERLSCQRAPDTGLPGDGRESMRTWRLRKKEMGHRSQGEQTWSRLGLGPSAQEGRAVILLGQAQRSSGRALYPRSVLGG